jgi:hypothetical protein
VRTEVLVESERGVSSGGEAPALSSAVPSKEETEKGSIATTL